MFRSLDLFAPPAGPSRRERSRAHPPARRTPPSGRRRSSRPRRRGPRPGPRRGSGPSAEPMPGRSILGSWSLRTTLTTTVPGPASSPALRMAASVPSIPSRATTAPCLDDDGLSGIQVGQRPGDREAELDIRPGRPETASSGSGPRAGRTGPRGRESDPGPGSPALPGTRSRLPISRTGLALPGPSRTRSAAGSAAPGSNTAARADLARDKNAPRCRGSSGNR